MKYENSQSDSAAQTMPDPTVLLHGVRPELPKISNSISPLDGLPPASDTRGSAQPVETSSARFLDELMRDDNRLDKAIDSYIRKIDRDGDGFVTDEEAEHGSFMNGDQRVIENLVKNGSPLIRNLSNDEWGFEDSGVTKDDIKAAFKEYGQISDDRLRAENAQTSIPAVFKNMDADGNGFLSKDELNESKLPNEPDFAKDVLRAIAIVDLHDNYDKYKGNSDDGAKNDLGVSLNDIFSATDSFYKKQTTEEKVLNTIFAVSAP